MRNYLFAMTALVAVFILLSAGIRGAGVDKVYLPVDYAIRDFRYQPDVELSRGELGAPEEIPDGQNVVWLELTKGMPAEVVEQHIERPKRVRFGHVLIQAWIQPGSNPRRLEIHADTQFARGFKIPARVDQLVKQRGPFMRPMFEVLVWPDGRTVGTGLYIDGEILPVN